MFHNITSLDLASCLGEVAPVQLDGLELLKQLRPLTGSWFPQVSPEVLTQATTQFIEYAQACRSTMRLLQSLPPVTLTTLPCMEFPL
jgi:hypothetical protein